MGNEIGSSTAGTQAGSGVEARFARRPDLDPRTRLWLAHAMECRSFNDWGIVSDLADKFGVSRQFLYDNLNRLRILASGGGAQPEAFDDESLHRLILCLRLHCNGSVEGIVRTLDEMGWSPGSAGHVSRFLSGVGSVCPAEVPPGVETVTLMLDETFTRGRPILAVMEASSHYLLSLVLSPDRKAATWEAELRRLQALGVDIEMLVKDQGSGLKSAAEALGLPERADLFHLLKPFDPPLPSLERRAYGAIAEADERGRVFDNRKTGESLAKALEKYEEAAIAADRAAQNFDDYDYTHRCLHESFDSFAADGALRTREMAEADIEAALILMAEAFKASAKVAAAVKFIRGNLDDYWGYFDQLEATVRRHAGTMPEHTLRAVCLAWQLDRKSMAVKSPGQKRYLARQSKELMARVLTEATDQLKADIETLLAGLDSNVRSSSPLEAVNSVIRAKLNSCRGQVTPEALALIAFHINHQRATRGKYAGTSPYERLTGEVVDESVIERLLRLAPRGAKWKVAAKLPGTAPSGITV
jgi:hypothetical protein